MAVGEKDGKSPLVGGFNPFEKYESKWESSPNRGENRKYLKTPPRIDSPRFSGPGVFFETLYLRITSRKLLFFHEGVCDVSQHEKWVEFQHLLDVDDFVDSNEIWSS